MRHPLIDLLKNNTPKACGCPGCKISRDPNSGYQPCHARHPDWAPKSPPKSL